MPLLFGIQQAVEGVVWLTFSHPLVNAIFTHVFVFFSHVLWPTYVPFAVLMIEKNKGRRTVLWVLLLIGLATSVQLMNYALIIGTPVAHVVGHSIAYETLLPTIPLGFAFYVLATCMACIVSSHKYIRVFGLALTASLIISYWSYSQTFYSVWCFFAAILSFIIYIHLRTDVVQKIKERAQDLRERAEGVQRRVKRSMQA